MSPNQILQRGGGILFGTARIYGRLTRRVLGEGLGLVQRARHLGRAPKPGMDDITIARKAESELFRGSGSKKLMVSVNVVDGVVWLRGEVNRPEQVRRLEQRALQVPEVRGVENLLHLKKTPAPSRADTPRRQQRTRSSTRRPAPRREHRVSDDHADAIAPQHEPSPAEHAAQGEGRTPAPLGSSGPARSGEAGSEPAADQSDRA